MERILKYNLKVYILELLYYKYRYNILIVKVILILLKVVDEILD